MPGSSWPPCLSPWLLSTEEELWTLQFTAPLLPGPTLSFFPSHSGGVGLCLTGSLDFCDADPGLSNSREEDQGL